MSKSGRGALRPRWHNDVGVGWHSAVSEHGKIINQKLQLLFMFNHKPWSLAVTLPCSLEQVTCLSWASLSVPIKSGGWTKWSFIFLKFYRTAFSYQNDSYGVEKMFINFTEELSLLYFRSEFMNVTLVTLFCIGLQDLQTLPCTFQYNPNHLTSVRAL